MRAVNLRVLSVKVRDDILPLYEKSLSNRDEEIKIRNDEIDLIRSLVEELSRHKITEEGLDKWFYSFSIPQISKEFDLLKVGENNKVVNIELKSQEVTCDRIKRQLEQNRYYLEHIAENIYSFTCVRLPNGMIKVYKLEDEKLILSTFGEIITIVSSVKNAVQNNLESLFEPKKFLVSPLNTPKIFLESRYYLTGHQEEIKSRIIRTINGTVNETLLWGIRGNPGTGKTLLLYDIAKELSDSYRVGMIHSGMLNEGHKYLNSHMKMDIIEAKSVTEEWISRYNVICVDETQRLHTDSMNLIIDKINSEKLRMCIFSYDPNQALSRKELARDNAKRLSELSGFREVVLSDKIRTNKELRYFIKNMMRLRDKPNNPVNYENIDIVYAGNLNDLDAITRYYRNIGYELITFTPSLYPSPYNSGGDCMNRYPCCLNSHQVIGQEFDKVLIVMDSNFKYDSNGELEAKIHPNPDYLFPKLFYQNITRAREKLCIVVMGNIELFEKLLRIKENA